MKVTDVLFWSLIYPYTQRCLMFDSTWLKKCKAASWDDLFFKLLTNMDETQTRSHVDADIKSNLCQ